MLRGAIPLFATMTWLSACAFELALDTSGGGATGSGTSSGASSSGTGGGDASIVLGPTTGMENGAPLDPAALCLPGECTIHEDPNTCAANSGAEQACGLVSDGMKVVTSCAPVGAYSEGEVCMVQGDCGPGLGCAIDGNGNALCRSYCCGDAELCPKSTYCEAQAMKIGDANPKAALMPVCVPASNCELLNDADSCAPGLTCTIVRKDGTTSCVVPGPGTLNEPCPCAAGFICSKLLGTCLKLCRIGQDNIDCGQDASCQTGSTAYYPPGIGTCVGGAK